MFVSIVLALKKSYVKNMKKNVNFYFDKGKVAYKSSVIFFEIENKIVIRCLGGLLVLLKFRRKRLIWIKNEKEPDS